MADDDRLPTPVLLLLGAVALFAVVLGVQWAVNSLLSVLKTVLLVVVVFALVSVVLMAKGKR